MKIKKSFTYHGIFIDTIVSDVKAANLKKKRKMSEDLKKAESIGTDVILFINMLLR